MAEFLEECAKRLDAGAATEDVLSDMRARYTTVRSLNVKTCLVRAMCTPTPEYMAELSRRNPELSADERTALARAAAHDPTMPDKHPPNVLALKPTRAERKECKRLGIRSQLTKNRTRVRVNGRELLRVARDLVRVAETCPVPHLILALLFLSGRRTCELLNGRSRFVVRGAHSLEFRGQAKRRRKTHDDVPVEYPVPVLDDAHVVQDAIDTLRTRTSLSETQKKAGGDNSSTSRRYQSWLSRTLKDHPVLHQVPRVHALRGLYACVCAKLFDWHTGSEDPSDAFVTMSVLGHVGLEESLVYTAFHLGDDFAHEPRLVDPTITTAA